MSDATLSQQAATSPTTARVAAGLTAAWLATRIITAPDRHPSLVAAAAGLLPPSPDEEASADGAGARAQRAARQVLLPQAERLLAPLAANRPPRAGTSVEGV